MHHQDLLVLTDLDGTLLDAQTYSWAPAAQAIGMLAEHRIPLVLVTSKTIAETLALREDLGNAHPFIVENGGATVVPDGYFGSDAREALLASESRPAGGARPFEANGRAYEIYQAGIGRPELCAMAIRLRQQLGLNYVTFEELGVEGIARETGLARGAAARANERIASEPLRWHDSEDDLHRFEAAVHQHGARCIRGGRFVHLQGLTDKADAARMLISAYRAAGRRTCLALGDAPNDARMLREADIAAVIRSPHGLAPDLADHPHVLRPSAPGPAGWAVAVRSVLAGESV